MGAATVDEVLPRQSELQDPAVANVDQVLLVFALQRPALDLKGATRQVSVQTLALLENLKTAH